MDARLGTLILTASLGLLGACTSDDSGATPPTSSSAPPSSSAPSTGGTESTALRLKGHVGTLTSCLPRNDDTRDYLWSGTWLAARDDVTITRAEPGTSTAMTVVGTWIVEDGKDDGEFVPWSSDMLVNRADLVRARGAELTAGSSYRVVLRMRATGGQTSQLTGIVVRYRDDSGGGTVTDDTTLTIANDC